MCFITAAVTSLYHIMKTLERVFRFRFPSLELLSIALISMRTQVIWQQWIHRVCPTGFHSSFKKECSLEHETGIDLIVSLTLKKLSKNYICFILRRFGLFFNPSSVKKIKHHLAMSGIQNHKALWRKKRQCDVKDVKRKTKTASHVKIAKSKSSSYAENAKAKST